MFTWLDLIWVGIVSLGAWLLLTKPASGNYSFLPEFLKRKKIYQLMAGGALMVVGFCPLAGRIFSWLVSAPPYLLLGVVLIALLLWFILVSKPALLLLVGAGLAAIALVPAIADLLHLMNSRWGIGGSVFAHLLLTFLLGFAASLTQWYIRGKITVFQALVLTVFAYPALFTFFYLAQKAAEAMPFF